MLPPLSAEEERRHRQKQRGGRGEDDKRGMQASCFVQCDYCVIIWCRKGGFPPEAAGPRTGTDPTNIIWLSTRLLTAIKARVVVRVTNPADIQQQKSHPLATNDPTTPSNPTLKPACPRPHSRSPFSPSGGGHGIGGYVSKYTVHVIEPRRHKSEETPLITAANRQPARCEGLLNNPWPREREGR